MAFGVTATSPLANYNVRTSSIYRAISAFLLAVKASARI